MMAAVPGGAGSFGDALRYAWDLITRSASRGREQQAARQRQQEQTRKDIADEVRGQLKSQRDQQQAADVLAEQARERAVSRRNAEALRRTEQQRAARQAREGGPPGE